MLRTSAAIFLLPLWHGFGAHATLQCKVLFDGRIAPNVQPADFDKTTSIYDHQFVHGQNQTWADIIKFPQGIPPSLFDAASGTQSFAVTINDNSIFVPGGGGMPQNGFRRSELIPATNNGTDATVQGTTTLHWSVRNDPQRPLNFSHEYHTVFHETADFSTTQLNFLTGTPFGSATTTDPRTLRIVGRQLTNQPETTFFQTAFTPDCWHNFAVTVGWDSNQFTVYYSRDSAPLAKVVGPVTNDNSGQGQLHVGMLKLPTGAPGIDVAHQGFQESNLNEGLIYGGTFIEDSSNGCISTS